MGRRPGPDGVDCRFGIPRQGTACACQGNWRTPMTNILVVDDTVDAAESLALLFDTLGHETHTAFDGEQALAAAEKYAPHIIFLDLDMPVRDGYEAARSIRLSKRTEHPFLVALTGQSGADGRR